VVSNLCVIFQLSTLILWPLLDFYYKQQDIMKCGSPLRDVCVSESTTESCNHPAHRREEEKIGGGRSLSYSFSFTIHPSPQSNDSDVGPRT